MPTFNLIMATLFPCLFMGVNIHCLDKLCMSLRTYTGNVFLFLQYFLKHLCLSFAFCAPTSFSPTIHFSHIIAMPTVLLLKFLVEFWIKTCLMAEKPSMRCHKKGTFLLFNTNGSRYHSFAEISSFLWKMLHSYGGIIKKIF